MKRKTLKFLYLMSFLPFVIAPFMQPIKAIRDGFFLIVTSRSLLLTDYIAVGGLGATLVNVGLVLLLSVILIHKCNAEINGTAIASVFLMGSFAFFGKNIINVLPILFGTLLYSKVTREPYKDIVHISLLSTSLAPLFNEIFWLVKGPFLIRLIIACLMGMSVGFIIKPISRHLYRVHNGFNLYNTGFAAGVLATVYVSLIHSLGFIIEPQSILYEGSNTPIAIALVLLFSGIFILGLIINPKALQSIPALFKETGHKEDFLRKYGLGVVLVNMTMNGYIALFYVIAIAQGSLTGPIIGGILTVVGFSGLGKTPANTIPLYIGVVIASLTNIWSINHPGLLLVALFGTALAPISGTYGPIWGIIAGFLNVSVAPNVRGLHEGLNLYNTGFASGVLAAVMVPLIKMIHKDK